MNYGLILAGGKGVRVGALKNKVLLPLNGKPELHYSIKAFRDAGIFDKIIIVVGEGEHFEVEEVLESLEIKNYSLVTGGKERQDSVRQGLMEIAKNLQNMDLKRADSKKENLENEDIILIHDSARPVVSVEEILSVYNGVKVYKAATVGVPVKDTIKRADKDGFAIETLPREELWGISTPQGFQLNLLQKAYVEAYKDGFYGTDDCMLVERIKERVKIIEGSYRNIKITTAEDLKIAQAFLETENWVP